MKVGATDKASGFSCQPLWIVDAELQSCKHAIREPPLTSFSVGMYVICGCTVEFCRPVPRFRPSPTRPPLAFSFTSASVFTLSFLPEQYLGVKELPFRTGLSIREAE